RITPEQDVVEPMGELRLTLHDQFETRAQGCDVQAHVHASSSGYVGRQCIRYGRPTRNITVTTARVNFEAAVIFGQLRSATVRITAGFTSSRGRHARLLHRRNSAPRHSGSQSNTTAVQSTMSERTTKAQATGGLFESTGS